MYHTPLTWYEQVNLGYTGQICQPVLEVQDLTVSLFYMIFFCEILSFHSTPKNWKGGLMVFLIPYVFMKIFLVFQGAKIIPVCHTFYSHCA